jgi:hypothetical protein
LPFHIAPRISIPPLLVYSISPSVTHSSPPTRDNQTRWYNILPFFSRRMRMPTGQNTLYAHHSDIAA